VTDTTPARRRLLALLLDRVDRDALLPAERPLLRALVTAEQDDATRTTVYREDVEASATRAEQAEAITRHTKELLARRTNTLRRRAERAERLLDSARKARLCGDCRINLDGAIEDASETPDDEQPDAPDTRLQAVTDALTAEHHRRARERIVASPEEHSAAMAAVALDAIDGRHWRGTDGADIATAYMDAQATLARVRALAERWAYVPGLKDSPRTSLLRAIDGPSPTPDDAQATADRAALDNAIIDDIARRAVEGDGTGQCLGVLAGNQAPGTLSESELPDDLPWAGEHDTPCSARYTAEAGTLGTPAAYRPVNYQCGLITGHLPVLHAKRQDATVFRWHDDIAVYPTTDDAPSEPQP
jgi:hypothetical protein